jgi:hypothetical protein
MLRFVRSSAFTIEALYQKLIGIMIRAMPVETLAGRVLYKFFYHLTTKLTLAYE